MKTLVLFKMNKITIIFIATFFIVVIIWMVLILSGIVSQHIPVEEESSKIPTSPITDDVTFDDSFILALAKVESNNNPKAHNKKTDAAGLLQITPIYIKEINKYSIYQFSLEDRFDSLKSIQMFKIFNRIHNPSFDIERAIFLHNPKAGNKYRLAILNKIKI